MKRFKIFIYQNIIELQKETSSATVEISVKYAAEAFEEATKMDLGFGFNVVEIEKPNLQLAPKVDTMKT